MTAVARVLRSHWLPSDWDAQRLLRFLAGLAMLAIAFGTPAASPSAPSPVVITMTASETSVTLSEPVSAPSPVRVEAAPVPTEGAAALVVATLITVLTGAVLSIRGGRAPPAA